MKKYLLAVLTVFLMGGVTTVPAQTQNPSQKSESIETVDDSTGIVAYSDTTAADTVKSTAPTQVSWDDYDSDEQFFNFLEKNKGWTIALIIIAIIAGLLICLAPFIILGLIIYLIVKNRRMSSELKEHSAEERRERADTAYQSDVQTDTQNRAIKNIFLGIGLIISMKVLGLNGLIAIGWLVLCWGIGQLVIARTTKKNPPTVERPEKNDTATRSSADDYVEVIEEEEKKD